MNRYLMTAGGRNVATRWVAVLFLAAWFVVPPAVGVLIWMIVGWMFADVLSMGTVALMSGFPMLLLFVAWPVMIFWLIHRAKWHLSQGHAAWLRGDAERAVQAAHFALTWVIRSDLRTAALHLLGLTAEASGDFGSAYGLFLAAKDATPAVLTSRMRGRLHAVLEAHLALAAAAGGRDDLVRDALGRGWHQVHQAQLPPAAFDVLIDDSGMPMPKFISVSSNLDVVEPRRDPRGLLFLAGTLAAFRSGNVRLAAEAGAGMNQWFNTLLPREALLFRVVMDLVMRDMDGPHRTAAPPSLLEGNPMRPWVERALGA